jgi:hypothetical protein
MLNKTRPITRPRWTAETEAELIRLREVEGLSWYLLDSHFGREHGASSKKYRKLKPGVVCRESQPKSVTELDHSRWTDADMTLAEQRWRDLFVNVYGESASRHDRYPVFEIIGRELKRTASAVENRLRLYGASFGLTTASKPLVPKVAEVSQAEIEARARYAAQLRQSPCARLMGDPPPGYSALDQRRQACTGAPRDSR